MTYIKLGIVIIMLILLLIQIFYCIHMETKKVLMLCLIMNLLNLINQFIR